MFDVCCLFSVGERMLLCGMQEKERQGEGERERRDVGVGVVVCITFLHKRNGHLIGCQKVYF